MYIMLSWTGGERPSLDILPENDFVTSLKLMAIAVEGKKSIQLWFFDFTNMQKMLIYPETSLAISIGSPEMK